MKGSGRDRRETMDAEVDMRDSQNSESFKQFKMQVNGDPSKAIEGVFTWNGTDRDLDMILEEAVVAGSLDDTSDLAATGDRDDVSLVIFSNDDAPEVVTPHIESDPVGASTFVVAVVLIYGISIVFLIASHVFIRKRTSYHKDSEKQINKYLEQAPALQAESRKESFLKLKSSLIPMIARSPSGRALIAKRVKYTPYLIQYLPFTALAGPQPPGDHGNSQGGGVLDRGRDRVPYYLSSSEEEDMSTTELDTNALTNSNVSILDSLVTLDDLASGRQTTALVHVNSDSDGGSYGSYEDGARSEILDKYLYGNRSLEDILMTQGHTSCPNLSPKAQETVV